MYWSIYEYCYETDSALPESRWKDNIDWMAASLRSSGYDMACTDGWIEGAQTVNADGYVTKYNSSWNNDMFYWDRYLKDRGMKLGFYYNPLWMTKAAWEQNLRVKGTPYRTRDLVGNVSFNDPLRWVDVDKPGAKEWIQGYVKHFKAMGVVYLRMDFLHYYEDAYGSAKYAKAMQWIREAAGEDMFLSMVMPHLLNNAAVERENGDMIRMSADTFHGDWGYVSSRWRWANSTTWPQTGNAFDGLIRFSPLAVPGDMILDGDFMRMNKLASDDERRFLQSLMVMGGSALAVADQHDTGDSHKWVYQNAELNTLNRLGFVGKPLSADFHDTGNSSRWIGQLPNGDWIVGLFNREDTHQLRSIESEAHLGISRWDVGSVRDLWTGQELAMDPPGWYEVNLKPHECRILRVSKRGNRLWAGGWKGTPPSQVHASTVSGGEWIYKGEAGDRRNFAGATADSDLTEVRVTSDEANVHFLVRMAGIANASLPAVGIALDTNQSAGADAGMDWIGDSSKPSGSILLGNAVQKAERQIMLYANGSGQPAIRIFHDGQWRTPGPGARIAIDAAAGVVEASIPRADLGISYPQRVTMSLATFRSSGNDAGSDATYNSPNNDNDAIDVMGGDIGVTADAWSRDLGDSKIDRYQQFVLDRDGAKAVQVENIWHYPFDGNIDASSDLWLNVAIWPADKAIGVTATYSLDGGSRIPREMTRNADTTAPGAWHVNLGKFNTGTTIRYGFRISDEAGNVIWYDYDGTSRAARVNADAADADGDGWPRVWSGTPPSQTHAATISSGEWIYKGEAGDFRYFGGATADSDLTEVRVTSDADYVYFLIRMAALEDATMPAVGIALDTDQSTDANAGMKWIGDSSAPAGSILLANAVQNAERQIMFYVKSDGQPAIRIFQDGQWNAPAAPGSAISCSAAAGAIEARIRRSDLGIEQPRRVTMTLATFRSSGADAGNNATFDSTDNNNDAIDVMGGEIGVSQNAWQRDLSDGTIGHSATFMVDTNRIRPELLFSGHGRLATADGPLDALSNLQLQVETYPRGSATSGEVGWRVNGGTWQVQPLAYGGEIDLNGTNDLWTRDLGSFAPGAVIDYYFRAVAPDGSAIFANNDGANYAAHVPSDADGDGLPDAWELANGLSIRAATGLDGPAGDPDMDGIPNILEACLGGNPRVADPQKLPVPLAVEGRLAVRFDRAAGTPLAMTVQGADAPAGPWTDLARSTDGAAFAPLAPGVAATESGADATRAVEVRDAYMLNDPAHPRRFLRLQIGP